MCPKLNCHLPCVWTLELTMYVLYIFDLYFYLRIGTCIYPSPSVLERSIAACSRGEHQIPAMIQNQPTAA